MTDDISKVVRDMAQCLARADFERAGELSMKLVQMTATTPAEVDGAVKALQSVAGHYEEGSCAKSTLLTASVLVDTLARQLAEAKAMLGQCYVMAGADTDGDAPERHAMDALRAVTDLRRDYDAAGEECYGRNGWQARAEQAESQLAAATRRVAEVETERDALRRALVEYPARNTHQLQAAKVCAGVTALATALQKETTA